MNLLRPGKSRLLHEFPVSASYLGRVCFWFSSLLRGFFSGYSGFPPSTKNQNFQIPIRLGNSGEKSHLEVYTEIPIYFIFILFIYLICREGICSLFYFILLYLFTYYAEREANTELIIQVGRSYYRGGS